MFFLDIILYKIACLIWPDEKPRQDEDERFFYFEEFVDKQKDDKDLPF